MQLILASSSPRRKTLLGELRIPFAVVHPEIDESPVLGEVPRVQAERLARLKAEAVAVQYPEAVVIGSDTIVTMDGVVYGKPVAPECARTMLQTLRGHTHEVLTAVAVVCLSRGFTRAHVECASVTLRHFTDGALEAYLATGEPLDTAGAYAVQGLGGTLVERVDGDINTVIGLPLAVTQQLLCDCARINL